jgi:hypothetical protein
MLTRLAIALFLAVACNFTLNAIEPASTEFSFEEPTVIQVCMDESPPEAVGAGNYVYIFELVSLLRSCLENILLWI